MISHHTIVEPPLPTGATGWGFWRDGEVNGFARTKNSLLIGFDMMPLRGLAETEQWMRARGWQCLPTRIMVAPESDQYGPILCGAPDADMICWGASKDNPEKVRWSMAGYIASAIEPGGYFRPAWVPLITADEQRLLRRFWTAWDRDPHDLTQPRDKRRRTTYQEVRNAVLRIFARLDLDVAPIRYDPVVPVSFPVVSLPDD